MSEWDVPLSDLDYGHDEEEAVSRVLRSRWLSMGAEVQEFEREFAAMASVKHAIAVANGTAALHLALAALGVGPGDEVIQPALNFVAAANMTVACGAEPRFADILGLDEPAISPDSVALLLSDRTKAVVVMHYGGYLCRMDEIAALCRQRGVALIEDACHAVGAHYAPARDRSSAAPGVISAGAMGDVGCFSFFSNKNLATGEGGMVVTNRDDIADRVRLLRSHGMTTLTWDRHRGHASSYDVVAHGYNYRIDEIRAALGRVQLRKLAANNARRGALVRAYRRALQPLAGWVVPFSRYAGESAYHLMAVVAPDPEARHSAAAALRDARIQSSLHYPCIPDFQAFRRRADTDVPLTRAYASRTITLPLYPTMTEDQAARVCKCLAAAQPPPSQAG